MKYAGIIENDFVNGVGVCVSVWVQGCPYRCIGCHNPQTWDTNGGIEIDEDELIKKVVSALEKNGVNRNLSILGGEPLFGTNPYFLHKLIVAVKTKFPNISVFLWTGAEEKEIQEMEESSFIIRELLHSVDVIVYGRFDISKRNVSLPLVGSTNQVVLFTKDGKYGRK